MKIRIADREFNPGPSEYGAATFVEGLQMRKMAAKIMNKQTGTAGKERFFHRVSFSGAQTIRCKNRNVIK